MSDPLAEAATAGVASAVSKMTTYPFDLLKTKMATSSDKSSSLAQTIEDLAKKEGVMGFYKGAQPKIFKSVTGKVLYFYIYRTLSNLTMTNGKTSLTALENMIIGFFSEVLELPVIMPLEAIATRAQVSKDKDSTFFKVANDLWKEDRLFVSLDAYVLGAFQPAIQNTIFDQLKAKINRSLTAMESFFLGVVASSIAITCTYPLDFARTVNQASTKATSASPQPLNVIIAGAPGSGKGTQCEKIAKQYSLVHLSTGDMLRAAVKAGTPVGLAAKAAMDQGQLVTDEIVIGCIQERISQPDVRSARGFLLDGFPRTPEQADALAKVASISIYIELDVPDSILLERVVGRRTDPVTNDIYHVKFKPAPNDEIQRRLIQRDDDREDKLAVRLKGYHQYCAAVRGKYSECYSRVEGNRSPNEVWQDIQSLLDTKVKQSSASDKAAQSNSMLAIWARTIQEYGPLGIFRGLSANLTQGVLSAALMLMVKEKIALIVTRWVQRMRALLVGTAK